MDAALMQAMLAVDDDHWWYRGRRRIIRAELDRLPLAPGARILDAGCGSGRTMQELAGYGAVSGIELSDEAVEVARSRAPGEVVQGRLEQLPWKDRTFELITCLDVIEHVPDDVTALLELLRVCAPGGWLLVTVPAHQALWSAHDVANHHYRRYSRAMLRTAARASGWELTRITAFNSLLLAPAAAVRLARRRELSHVAARAGLGGDGSAAAATTSPTIPPKTPSTTPSNGDGAPVVRGDLKLAPGWLNGALERPLALEAAWLARGRTLPLGLSLLAVLRRPADP